ncbi:MAG TPA: hypothetical protein DCL41_09225 [Bdellovibrionales bacterium]|nr:hypothetical protein [Bdellovibrionales bacterium]
MSLYPLFQRRMRRNALYDYRGNAQSNHNRNSHSDQKLNQAKSHLRFIKIWKWFSRTQRPP